MLILRRNPRWALIGITLKRLYTTKSKHHSSCGITSISPLEQFLLAYHNQLLLYHWQLNASYFVNLRLLEHYEQKLLPH